MLKSWSIENFKPIVNSGTLQFAPVTVLAGRNSSGKSSLIQSILMVAQTLSSPATDRPLLPNGPLVQLGTFGDILNEKTQSQILTIGFELEVAPQGFLSVPYQAWKVKFSSPAGDINSAAVDMPNAVVENISIKCNVEREDIINENDISTFAYKIDAKIDRILPDQAKQLLKDILLKDLRLLSFTGEQSVYLATIGQGTTTGRKQSFFVTLSHFLPISFFSTFKLNPFSIREDEHEQYLRSYLLGNIYLLLGLVEREDAVSQSPFPDLIDFESPISEGLQEALYKLCQEENIEVDIPIQSLHSLLYRLKSLKVPEDREKLIANKLLEVIVHYLFYEAERLEETTPFDSFIEGIELTGGQIKRFFTSKIRYLSSLRTDPWTVQQRFAPTGELDEVGAKGEYAAQVYHASRNATIEWYNPESKQVERGTLKIAVDTWARYLGIANQISTEIAGSLGVTWRVVLKEDQKARTLPEVGGGVNHILPVLVMGLLSPRDTLLIMEEPEVTLHPTVQARLGDFFVGQSKCQKQFLIETHSENLVSQLRYHIVESGGMEKSDCMIYFVDQDEKGAAQFDPVQISARGNILNWPDGFFDETLRQQDRITAASLRQRAKIAKNE